MEGYSLSDIATASEGGMGGSNWIVLLIIFAMIFGGNGLFGNRGGEQYATTSDVQRATDFQALERQNNEIMQNTSTVGANVIGAIKDGNYNTLGELRDLQSEVTNGFANAQKCCCETLRAIDSVNYNGAINTASINATTTAQTQKILDAMAQNKIESLQAQVSELKTQNMFCGIPRINPYGYGVYPYGNCGCNMNNI